MNIRITLKGIFFLAFGGFTAEAKGVDVEGLCEKAERALTDQLKDGKRALAYVDGALQFVSIVPTHTDN